MQNKKSILMMGAVILVVGIAAFVGGRLLNATIGTVGLGGENGNRVTISIDEVTPAPELPPTKGDITGTFVERRDNTIVVQAVTFDAGVGGVSGNSPMDQNSGVQVEIVITSQTEIYRDVTEFPVPVNGEIHNVQQAAEEGTLEDLTTDTYVTVWGRRSGDRVVADVLFYSNPRMMKKPN